MRKAKKQNLKNYKLSEDILSSTVNNLNSGLIQEEYSGMFETDLRKILNDEPLTFENLHKALKDNKLTCKQIQRIIQKINANQEQINYILKLFHDYQESTQILSDYVSKKLIHPKITRDKFYIELRDSIRDSKLFLKEKYHIKNEKDVQKKVAHSKKRYLLAGKLSKLQRLKLQERSLIILSIKKLVKKVRGSIVSLHPELAQYVEFLSFEQLSNLKTLCEEFNFSPKSKDDFTKEIRLCKANMKKEPLQKDYYKLKMKLLESVSSELHKNLTHARNLEKGYSREQTTDRIIDYGKF